MPGKQAFAMIKFELIDLNLMPGASFSNQLSSFLGFLFQLFKAANKSVINKKKNLYLFYFQFVFCFVYINNDEAAI